MAKVARHAKITAYKEESDVFFLRRLRNAGKKLFNRPVNQRAALVCLRERPEPRRALPAGVFSVCLFLIRAAVFAGADFCIWLDVLRPADVRLDVFCPGELCLFPGVLFCIAMRTIR